MNSCGLVFILLFCYGGAHSPSSFSVADKDNLAALRFYTSLESSLNTASENGQKRIVDTLFDTYLLTSHFDVVVPYTDRDPLRYRDGELASASRYIIDRFEDKAWVVLEDAKGETFNVPRHWLPDLCSEGDVIVVERQAIISVDEVPDEIDDKVLVIYVDETATQKRREAMLAIRKQLKKAKAGNITL